MERAEVVSGPEGTEVRLSQRLGRAEVTTAPAPALLATPAPEPRSHVAVSKLTDDVDLSNAEKLYHELIDGMDDEAIGLVVDLSEVRYVDSSGIRMLHKLASWLAKRRRELRVVVPGSSSIRRVLELGSFDDHLPVTDTVASAVSEINCARSGLSLSDLLAE
jgi:anti-anti-sigma factor